MVAQQRNVFDRDIETPVDQLPDRLNIISEVEAPILEIRPARVGGPGPDKEMTATVVITTLPGVRSLPLIIPGWGHCN
jgi:hypothetical protein